MWILGFCKMDFQSGLNFHSRHSIRKQTVRWQSLSHFHFSLSLSQHTFYQKANSETAESSPPHYIDGAAPYFQSDFSLIFLLQSHQKTKLYHFFCSNKVDIIQCNGQFTIWRTFVSFAIWQRSVFMNFFSFSSICSYPFQLLISKQSIGVIFPSCKISLFISCRENRERLQLINNNNSDFAILRLGQNSKRVYFLSCKSYHLILVNQEVFNFTISGSAFQSDLYLDSKTHFDFLSIPKRYL